MPYIATEEIVQTTYQAMQHADEVIIVCGTVISLNIVTNSSSNCVERKI